MNHKVSKFGGRDSLPGFAAYCYRTPSGPIPDHVTSAYWVEQLARQASRGRRYQEIERERESDVMVHTDKRDSRLYYNNKVGL